MNRRHWFFLWILCDWNSLWILELIHKSNENAKRVPFTLHILHFPPDEFLMNEFMQKPIKIRNENSFCERIAYRISTEWNSVEIPGCDAYFPSTKVKILMCKRHKANTNSGLTWPNALYSFIIRKTLTNHCDFDPCPIQNGNCSIISEKTKFDKRWTLPRLSII